MSFRSKQNLLGYRNQTLGYCMGALLTSQFFQPVMYGQDTNATKASSKLLNLSKVKENAPDEPRATPITRDAMKQYLEDLKARKPRIPLPELTAEEKKASEEDPRTFGYEGRIRKLYLPDVSVSNYLPFGGSPANSSNANRSGPLDPKMSLGYDFKVRLFWIAARGNNCQYCLGHQESKLLATGMTEDQIAALDSEWEKFPESEQVAFSLARRLTLEPHKISDGDIAACKKFYSDEQIIEMLGSVSGNNAINRWKEGAGIPQSHNGGNFGAARGSAAPTSSPDGRGTDSHSYLTATSESYANRTSKVIELEGEDVSLRQIAPTKVKRPPLEVGDELMSKLSNVRKRQARLPLADAATTNEVMAGSLEGKPVLQWHRLLAQFPIAGKRFADGFISAKKSDALPPALQAKMDWVVARQDRAWYAAALAWNELQSAGMSVAQIEALDGNLLTTHPSIPESERVLLVLAKNLAASPIVLTDKQVTDAIEVVGPRAVTQAINYTAYRAAFNRLTEAAGLQLEQ